MIISPLEYFVAMIKIKKPAALIKKQKEKKSLDTIWPEVMQWVLDHPKVTNEALYNMFADRAGEDCEVKSFIHKCNLRGLKQLKMTGKKKPIKAMATRQLTEETVLSFEQARRRKGMVHLEKMDMLVTKAHSVINKESKIVAKGGKEAPSLSEHLDNMNKIHKIGASVYKIDADSGENNAKVNIAILTNFNPSEAQIEAKVIDVYD